MTSREATARPVPVILAIGAIAGLMTVALTLSFATLVYSGQVAQHLSIGAGLFLFGAAALNLVAARGTSLAGSVLVPQDSTTAVVAVTLAAIVPSVAQGDRLGTVFMFGLIATAAAGAVMVLLGLFRLGAVVRLVPYPVIGGFLAGTGWLLVAGGVDLVTAGFTWSAATVAALVGAVIFAGTLVVVLRNRPNIVIFPAMVVGAVVVFYLALALSGTSLDEARSLGLLAQLPATSFRVPLQELTAVDWSAIAAGIGGLLTVPLVATLAMLLNVTGLEMMADTEADLNRELRVVGGANLLAAFTGSPAGYHTLGITALGYRVGVASSWVPLIAAVVCLAAVVGGTTLVTLLPTPLVGGLLLLIGLSFLADWLLDGRRQMTAPEYVLMLAITVAVAMLGFLAAVLLGMAAAVALFAVAYSRVEPIRHVSTGMERRSTMQRHPRARRALTEHGESIVVIELQGYLFFGTARSLLARAQEILDANPALTCLIIDMRRVQGTDATALASFLKLLRLARRSQFQLIYSDLPSVLAAALDRAVAQTDLELSTTPDLDRAMELAEDHVLGDLAHTAAGTSLSHVFGAGLWAKLQPLLDRYEVGPGDLLIDVGDESVGLFLVDYGRIVAEIPAGDGRWQRVVCSGPGTVLGEISLYAGGGRTARLRAEERTCAFTLSDRAIRSLEESDPAAAADLHRHLATVLAERLALSNETVGALLR